MRRDEAAFVDFAAGARTQLRRTAYLACGDWDRASDHVQEALVKVYVAWPRLQRKGREHAYARKALMSVIVDHHRRRSSTETPIDTTVEHAVPGSPGRAVVNDPSERLALRTSLMSALDHLPPRQRACLVLRYFEDFSITDTAAALGITEGTVKSQTSRALATVREHLAGLDHDLFDAPVRDAREGAST